MPEPTGSTATAHVFLLEDEWLIALDLQEVLEAAGHVIVGPVSSIAAALSIIRDEREPISAGLLDLHVGRETSYPVAQELRNRGIPFAFLTGHNREDLRPEFQSQPLICKPATGRELLRRLNQLLIERPLF